VVTRNDKLLRRRKDIYINIAVFSHFRLAEFEAVQRLTLFTTVIMILAPQYAAMGKTACCVEDGEGVP
jgi:hypothetical protein